MVRAENGAVSSSSRRVYGFARRDDAGGGRLEWRGMLIPVNTVDRVVSPPLQYMQPWAKLGKAHSATEDLETGRKVWEWAEEQCKEWLEPLQVIAQE